MATAISFCAELGVDLAEGGQGNSYAVSPVVNRLGPISQIEPVQGGGKQIEDQTFNHKDNAALKVCHLHRSPSTIPHVTTLYAYRNLRKLAAPFVLFAGLNSTPSLRLPEGQWQHGSHRMCPC